MRVAWGCLLGTLLIVPLAYGAPGDRPPRSACSKKTQGQLWPEQANADRDVAAALMHSGEVYM
jgi:hypothetical protein